MASIRVGIEWAEEELWPLAQFLKRVTFTTMQEYSTNNDDAYRMLAALNRLRDALRHHGYAPP